MSAITAKASRKMKKYAVLTREPRCFLGSFDFSWEQRKLEDLVDVCSGRDYKHLSEGPIPVYGTGGYMLSVNEALSYNEDAIGIGRKGTIDKPYILKAPFWTVDTLFYAIPREKIDLTFVFDIFQNIDWKKKDESTGVPSLSKTAINDIDVLAPIYDEQQAIGQFFSKFDNLITLHQRKCVFLFGFFQAFISMIFTASTFSWEQRKLGEIGSVSMCRRIFKEQTSETGDIPFYKIGTFGADPDAFISRELFEEYKSKYPYPQKGDILISASGSIGRTVEFAGNNEYFQDSNIVWLNHDERLSNPFLKCFYSVVKWAGIEGSTIKRLYNDNILNTVICMPSVPEQKRIGLFFENLDNLITLHQRECISFTARAGRLILTANKKRNTSSWEQRKLGEVVNVYDGVHQTPDYKDSGIMFLSVENIGTLKSKKYISEEAFNRDYKVYPQKGDILMTRIGDVGTPNVVETTEKMAFYVSLALLKPINVDSYFLCDSILSPFFQNGLKERTLVTAIPQKINKDDIGKVSLFVPISKDEQRQIGAFFTNINNLITLHQRKPFLMKWRTSDANRNQTNRLVL